MRQERVRRHPRTREGQQEAPETVARDAVDTSDIDALLEEIDEVLDAVTGEESIQEFVAANVQAGGE